jgi:two-component system LytT family response regulator
MKHTVLIVDDEPNARDYLKVLVENDDTVVLCGVCKSGNEVIEFCKTIIPDIIFIDIQMPGNNGIDTAQVLMKLKGPPVIVFVTAFDQYAIQAFEVEAIGYLLKPFSKEQFAQHLARAVSTSTIKQKVAFNERMQSLFEQYAHPSPAILSELLIQEKGLEIRIPVDQIQYILSDSEYVTLYTKTRRYLKRLALKLLEKQLPSSFMRIHRSTIINKRLIVSWKYLNNGTFSFEFENKETQTSSRSYQQIIRKAVVDPRSIN